MNDCIFCRIAEGKIPSSKIWEDDKFMAFLDIKPVMKGMTLVIPKAHHDSYLFNQSDELVSELIKASRTVAKMLENAFNVKRIALVAEGIGVNHLHMKLYPLHGYDESVVFTAPKESLYFEKYEGFISTQTGPQTNSDDLNELAKFIVEKNA